MLVLSGKNLGERQRELNAKVIEVASNNVDFEQVKDAVEKSDVDKLFKIDLASKNKNIEYLIEVLKSGDSLHISRVLKSLWFYDDEFSHVVNVDNLQKNVIPFMSMKMQKKLLSSISSHVRNEERAASFYKYCMDLKLKSIGLKFLNFTSETFKLEVMKDSKNHSILISIEDKNVQHLIGLSFTLADAYVSIFHDTGRLKVIRLLSYLYTVSDVKYLDMLEKYVVLPRYCRISLGSRISERILKKHKMRILENPSIYIEILEKNILARYSTEEDSKKYLIALMPKDVQIYWSDDFCQKYKFFIDKLSTDKFKFIKQMFNVKYPMEEFEMTSNFYYKNLYKIMTPEERDSWALKQIASGSEILGSGQDYLWYKFVSFEKAFKEIKTLIMLTLGQNKRAEMINILIESAKNQRDVEKLLNYYYERHNNEQRYMKENFVDRIIESFNVYEFDDECWASLDKIFHSLEIYSTTNPHNSKSEYKIIALIYCVLHKKDVPDGIKQYISNNMYFYLLKTNTDKLTKEQTEIIYQYLYDFMTNEIKKFENVSYDDDVKCNLKKYIHFILDLLNLYGRTKDDCPEIVNKFMQLDWSEYKAHALLKENESIKPITQDNLLRYLKKDAKIVVESLPQIRSLIDSSYTKNNISQLLKKLKIYFSNDIAKNYLNFFNELLSNKKIEHRTAHAAVHGILQLGDETFKNDFMTKNAPTDPKIDHVKINKKLLRIREAICAHALYSRPPVPLKIMLLYIKGDYTLFCLPLFNSYLAKLPLPLCLEFIEAILDTPVSVQKHGVRLAFECFEADTLNKLVLSVWKKNKNVSLRKIIFKALINKISVNAEAQDILFDTLKTITLTLHQADDDELFVLLAHNRLPSRLKPEYIEVAWKVVRQLPSKIAHLKHMRSVIQKIDENIISIRPGVVQDIVDEFIFSVFNTEEKGDLVSPFSSVYISNDYEKKELIEAQWDLTAKYITCIQDKEDLDTKLKLTKSILDKCVGPLQAGICKDKYFSRVICHGFIKKLEGKSYEQDFKRYENVNALLQFVVTTLEDNLPIEEIYMLIWELRLGLVARKVIMNAKMKFRDEQVTDDLKDYIARDFANEIGNLIKEFVKNKTYFSSFSRDIKEAILGKIYHTYQIQFNVPHGDNSLLYKVALGLMQCEIDEIYLLVVDLLPSDVTPPYDENFKLIISKIKNLKNKEIMCKLVFKFVNSNFKVKELCDAFLNLII